MAEFKSVKEFARRRNINPPFSIREDIMRLGPSDPGDSTTNRLSIYLEE